VLESEGAIMQSFALLLQNYGNPLWSETSAALSVPETEQREVLAFIESLRDEIVKS
jgi:hypothetical protein